MRSEELSLIRELALFAKMDDASFSDLMRAAYFQRFPPAIQLIAEGQQPDFLHVVVEGVVELFAGTGKRETVMEIVRPIETFILAAVLRDQAYLMSARTLESSRILMVPSHDVRTIFERDAVFARAVVSELAGRYRSMVKALKNQKLRTSVERLANYLLRCRVEQGGKSHIRLNIGKRTLAAYLGMTPENLSRAFATLARHGVKVEGSEIRLARPDDLSTFARPNPLMDDPQS